MREVIITLPNKSGYVLCKMVGEEILNSLTHVAIYTYLGIFDENLKHACVKDNLTDKYHTDCLFYEEYDKTIHTVGYFIGIELDGRYLKTFIPIPTAESRPKSLIRYYKEDNTHDYYLYDNLFVNSESTHLIQIIYVEYKKFGNNEIKRCKYYQIDQPYFELRTNLIISHGHCPINEPKFKLPSNVIIIMNCYNIISHSIEGETFQPAFDVLFKDIRYNFENLTLKINYLNLLKKMWDKDNVQFCVFTEECPDIIFGEESAIYELPIQTHQRYLNPPIIESLSTLSTNLDHNTLETPSKFSKFTQLSDFAKYLQNDNNFHVIHVCSCRQIPGTEHIRQQQIGVPFGDAADPSLFSLIFNKFNQKYVKSFGGGALTYKYNVLGKERDFTYKDSNLWTKYDRKWVSLLDTLLLEDKLAKQHIDGKGEASGDGYTKTGKTHKCVDGKVRTLYSKGKSFYVKMKGVGKGEGDGRKYEYKKVNVKVKV
jgi:hypothetical protein